MSTITGGRGANKQDAIAVFGQKKAVDVSAADFVYDANTLVPLAFKLKVSKGCFLKVQLAGEQASDAKVQYFQVGENNELVVKVYTDAGNVDETGAAFDGSSAGSIMACR